MRERLPARVSRNNTKRRRLNANKSTLAGQAPTFLQRQYKSRSLEDVKDRNFYRNTKRVVIFIHTPEANHVSQRVCKLIINIQWLTECRK